MSVDSMFLELKIDWQAAGHVEAATHPGDEQVFAR
jgi:hypothetical protein